MASLSELENHQSIKLSCKKDNPLRFNPEDLEYDNLIKNMGVGKGYEIEDEHESLEEKIAIKSGEIISLFRSLRNKSETLNKEITARQTRIDELNSKLEATNQAVLALSVTTRDLELDETIKEFQMKIRESVNKQIGTNEEQLVILLKDVEKVNESLAKINALVFTGVTESLKPDERERIATGKQCPICITNTINRALDCGHVLCDTCVSKIGSSCYMCRSKYNKVIPLFMGSGSAATDEVSVPAPTVQVSPWFPLINENQPISSGELIGVNTVGGHVRSRGWI